METNSSKPVESLLAAPWLSTIIGAGRDPDMAPEERKIWLDGEFVPWPQATLHVLSHAAQRGALVFDYMSVHETDRGTAIFRLGEHLKRFRQSCEILGLPLLQADQDHKALAGL